MEIYDRGADLYDLAFSWDVSGEVDWLLERLGPEVASVLEPGCGSGRMFPAFARRGVEIFGVDLSAEMLTRAASRMAPGAASTLCADMAEFDAGRRFDGAICPINTFGYLLSPERALEHLECVARHLRPGARYLVQVDLEDLESVARRDVDGTSTWEVERDGVKIRATVRPSGLDRATGVGVETHRYEVLEGPDAGLVFEEDHRMRVWSWRGWSALIAASPFEQVAAHDGNHPERPALPLDARLETARLTWHELMR